MRTESRAWSLTPVILEFGRLRQENRLLQSRGRHEQSSDFPASLGYKVRPSFKKQRKKKRKEKKESIMARLN